MPNRHDDPDEESEALSSRRVVHNHYTQLKNGNGNGNGHALNTLVWSVAAFGVLSLATIMGIMWSKQIETAESLARLEAQMVIVLQRLPP